MIRVLRIMEYEFDDYESYELHFSHTEVPAVGVKNFGRGKIKSTVIVSPFEETGEDDGNER